MKKCIKCYLWEHLEYKHKHEYGIDNYRFSKIVVEDCKFLSKRLRLYWIDEKLENLYKNSSLMFFTNIIEYNY